MRKNINNPNKKPLSKDAKIGIDKHGREYIYNGEIQKAISPIQHFKPSKNEQHILDVIEYYSPIVFNKEAPLPLIKGVRSILLKELKENSLLKINSTTINRVLKFWCGSIPYKKSLMKNTHRYDLKGNPVEKLSIDDRKDAEQALKFFIQQYNWKKAKDLKKSVKSKSNTKIKEIKMSNI